MSYQWPTLTDWLEQIAPAFYQQGYVVLEQAIPAELCWQLYQDVQQQSLKAAGVGRQGQHQLDQQVRRDHTAWLDSDNPVQQQYLQQMALLQQDMNQRCFLGLILFVG